MPILKTDSVSELTSLVLETKYIKIFIGLKPLKK
jgi:hypothetical protein